MQQVRRPPGLKDVAQLAGVSHQTVSRVLNELPGVRVETRERVIAAMRALDYQPNSAARTLVTNRSQTLGLVTFDTTLIGPSFMVYAIERAAREAGYFVSIASAKELDVPSVNEAIRRLREQSVEGIVSLAPVPAALAALAEVPAGIPLVGVGLGTAGAAAELAKPSRSGVFRQTVDDVPMVAVDNVAGAALATRHLVELGHRTVHHVSGPDGWPEAQERMAGWRQVLREVGRPVPAVIAGDWSAKSGYDAGRQLARDPGVTAVFCGNDQMAIGVLRALHEIGRAVPEEVSVVGFDDIPEAAYFQPPLTTVRQDFAELGRRSLQMLVAQITTGHRGERQTRFTPPLVVRHSTSAI